MGRRTVVFALGLSAFAAFAWHRALHRESAKPAVAASAFKLPKLVAPPTFEVLTTIDGEILDLGYGFEVTPPAAVEVERINAHVIRFSDFSDGVLGLVQVKSATEKKLHENPLEAARVLAHDQNTKITTFETTSTGSFVQFDGTLGEQPMRQYVISTYTNKGRISVWLMFAGPSITSPGAKRLVEEFRHGGRVASK
ncbi:MAG TPA: hypothetical protein VGM90_35890 [Kofleriaceae bacterium]|jgi:hypothetical protein